MPRGAAHSPACIRRAPDATREPAEGGPAVSVSYVRPEAGQRQS